NDQHYGDDKGLNDLFHALRNSARLVERYGVFHTLGKALLHLRHQRSDSRSGVHGVGARQLINRDDSAGLAIEAADHAVILRAQFDPGEIFYANDAAVGSRAHDDVSELLGRGQAALREDGIGKLLVLRSWITA